MIESDNVRDDAPPPEVSVIVPVHERAEPLDRIYSEFAEGLAAAGVSAEFIFVLEPWRRELVDALTPLIKRGAPIKVLIPSQTVGESALLHIAVSRVRAPIVITLPAYRRVVPEALLELKRHVDAGADMATARREGASTSLLNRAQNRVFHFLLGKTVGGGFRDIASGVRVMRREVLEDVPLYGDFFRFLPVLAYREGFRVEEVAVPRHEHDRRPRIYSPGVYLRRLIDVLGLMFLVRFTQKPLRFFGLVGSVFSLVGVAILAMLFVQRMRGTGIADRPALLLGVLLLVMGVQSLAMGLIGEIVVHFSASRRRLYRLHGDQLDGTPMSETETETEGEGLARS